jgi:hypothetical protein
MSKETPDHHDAEIVMRLYDLRREALMRESRKAVAAFWPRSYDELFAVLKPDHPLNAPFRQVSTYWEMAYGFARHGIVHADLLLETGGEGIFLFAKAEPYLERFRQEYSAVALRNAEWASRECAEGRRLLEVFRARVRKVLETKPA